MIYVAHDGHDRRTGDFNLADILILHEVFEGLVGHLVFKRNDLGIGAELGRHILYQLSVERLVDGDKNAPHQERRNQVLAAHAQLFRQILYADAFCHRDRAGDWHRFLRNLRSAETRRRRKALHWAFLGLRILLPSAALLRSRSLRPGSFAWRRRQTTGTAHAGTGGATAGPRGAETRASAGAGSSTGLSPGWVHRPARTSWPVLGSRRIS